MGFDRSPNPENLNMLDTSIKKYDIKLLLVANDTESLKECAICYEQKETNNDIELNCKHKFCANCVEGIIKHNNSKNVCNPCCALCRQPINTLTVAKKEVFDIISTYCL